MQYGFKNLRAFSLIELSIVIVIIGILLAVLVSGYKVYYQQKQLDITDQRLSEARRQVEAFQAKYGYLPCPAAPSNANAVSTDCSNPTVPASMVRVATAAGQHIRIGTFPMNITVAGETKLLATQQDLVDGWGGKLGYAVIEEESIDTASTTMNGSIIVKNLAGADISTTSRYILFSHGSNGIGAYTLSGNIKRPCPTGATRDSENCDGDHTFVSLGANEGRSMVAGQNEYDDFVAMDKITGNNCPAGSVVIGIAPDGTPICSAPMTCPDNKFLKGMDPDGNPICVQTRCRTVVNKSTVAPSFVSTASCAAGEFLTGGGLNCERKAYGDDVDGFPHLAQPLGGSWVVDCFGDNNVSDAESTSIAICCRHE